MWVCRAGRLPAVAGRVGRRGCEANELCVRPRSLPWTATTAARRSSRLGGTALGGTVVGETVPVVDRAADRGREAAREESKIEAAAGVSSS